jgi:exopolysaccharide biosynthesis polyprenyl glycosylphosphotransferase
MHSSVGVSKKHKNGSAEFVTAAPQVLTLAPPRRTAADFRRAVVAAEALADLITISAAVTLGYTAYYQLALGKHVYYSTHAVVGASLVLASFMVLMLDRVGAYGRGNSLLRVRETERVLRVSAQALLIALALSFFGSFLFSRWVLVICAVLVPLSLFVQKTFTYLFIRSLHSRGYGIEKVLIYGAGCTGRRVFSVLSQSPKLGLDPVAFVDEDPNKTGATVFEMGYERRRSAPVLPGPITREWLENQGIDLVIIAIPAVGREKFIQTVQEALSANARVSFVPSHFLPSDPLVDYQDIDGVLLASFGKYPRRFGYEMAKRVCDVVGSLLLMILGLPVLAILALLIKLDSRGPVFFLQERVGQNGKLFSMLKFRTMQTSAAPYDLSPRTSKDPRITRIGRLLRLTSFDELPQLVNVFRGSMSMVGPRPEMPFIVDQYGEREWQRLQVKPGLTGLWQLSGDRAFLIHENVEYDLYYIQHRNFFMDMAILLHTSIFAMRGI